MKSGCPEVKRLGKRSFENTNYVIILIRLDKTRTTCSAVVIKNLEGTC